MQDEQKTLFEFLVAGVINAVFLVLIAAVLWPLGLTSLATRFALGYVVLWIFTGIVALLGDGLQKIFRVNLYDHPNAYVISNLAASCLLQAGWSTFAAFTVHNVLPRASIGMTVTLYLIGALSCLVAFFAVSSFYQGHIYKLISLPLALMCFILVSIFA